MPRPVFIDAREALPDPGLRAGVCIVGGGVAGITMALSLARSGIDVLLVESGGFSSDPDTDELYAGVSTDVAYAFDRRTRSRFLGGSSNCWGGWCRPLEEEDFASRSWVRDSGWPFPRTELKGYYDQAHDVLDLGPTDYSQEFWAAAIDHPQVRTAPLDESRAHAQWSQFAGRLRLGERYRNDLATSQHVRVLLHANLTRIRTDATGHVTGSTLSTLGGRELAVTADRYVLATGGVENARLLLASIAAGSPGLGNDHDLVGRYFMDHPRRLVGNVRLRPGFRGNRLHDIRSQDRSPVVAAHGTMVAAAFSLSAEVLEREGLLNGLACFRTMLAAEDTETVDALRRLRRMRTHGEQMDAGHRAELVELARHPLRLSAYLAARRFRVPPLTRGVQLEMMVEPDPDPGSRVTLSSEVDALGMPRAHVEWRLSDQVGHTFERTTELLAVELARAGVADVEPLEHDPDWRAATTGTWHHMGTTRMHDSPRHGVVDRDGRVHGSDNLYVAGSSVFPTYGANYPTLTLTALALRLADHLVTRMRTPVRVVDDHLNGSAPSVGSVLDRPGVGTER